MRIPSALREKRTPYPERSAERSYDVKRQAFRIDTRTPILELSQRVIVVGETQEVPHTPESTDAYEARLARLAREANKVTPSHYHAVRFRDAIVKGKRVELRIQESVHLTHAEAEAATRKYMQTEGRAYAPKYLTDADESTLVRVRVSACHKSTDKGKFGRGGRLERLVCKGK